MALHISHHLARLIRARSYALGALTRTQRKLAALRLKVEKAELAAIDRRVKLDELDAQIKAVAPGIDPSNIRGAWKAGSRRTWPKGAFNRVLADVLKAAQGNILTDDAMSQVAAALGVSLEDPERFRYFRGLVVRQLRYWVADGFLERHALRVDGVRQILWRLTGPTNPTTPRTRP